MKTKPYLCFFTLLLTSFYASGNCLSEEIDTWANHLVDSGNLHGCVTLIQQNDELLHFDAYGFKSIERNEVMETDTLFRVASMTKILTALGALKLYEEGFFLLDDPLKKYMPEFSNMEVIVPLASDLSETVVVGRDITIRDLFRHTAGFGMEYSPNDNHDVVDREYIAKQLSSTEQTGEAFIQKISQIPLKYSPGQQWQYSYSNDILGFLIERITGKTLHEYLDEVLFKPLRMTSTGFYVDKENAERLSSNYVYENNKLTLLEDSQSSPYLNKPTVYSGGGGFENNEGGLVTSAEDFAKICSMILNYGRYEGKQVFLAPTIELMISDQISAIPTRGFSVPGYGLGIGVSSHENSGRTTSVFWSGGPYNTTFTIDFQHQLISIFLTQNSPWWHKQLIPQFNSIVTRTAIPQS